MLVHNIYPFIPLLQIEPKKITREFASLLIWPSGVMLFGVVNLITYFVHNE